MSLSYNLDNSFEDVYLSAICGNFRSGWLLPIGKALAEGLMLIWAIYQVQSVLISLMGAYMKVIWAQLYILNDNV